MGQPTKQTWLKQDCNYNILMFRALAIHRDFHYRGWRPLHRRGEINKGSIDFGCNPPWGGGFSPLLLLTTVITSISYVSTGTIVNFSNADAISDFTKLLSNSSLSWVGGGDMWGYRFIGVTCDSTVHHHKKGTVGDNNALAVLLQRAMVTPITWQHIGWLHPIVCQYGFSHPPLAGR